MAALSTALLAIGTAVGVGGAVMQYGAQQDAQKAQRSQDLIRQDAMRNDAQRRRREIMRQAALARATALSTATAQGAANPGASALPGAYGQIQGQGTRDVNAVNIAEAQGNQMFALNRQVDSAYRSAALGGTVSSIGGGISSLGGALQSTGSTFGSVGAVTDPKKITVTNDAGTSYLW